MKAVLLLLIILMASLFLASCTKVDSTDIVDLQREPATYANQDIIVVGRVSKEIVEGSESHFTYFLKDYSSQKIRLGCLNYELLHNQKYSINARFVFNNQTGEYFLRCNAPPKKVGGIY